MPRWWPAVVIACGVAAGGSAAYAATARERWNAWRPHRAGLVIDRAASRLCTPAACVTLAGQREVNRLLDTAGLLDPGELWRLYDAQRRRSEPRPLRRGRPE